MRCVQQPNPIKCNIARDPGPRHGLAHKVLYMRRKPLATTVTTSSRQGTFDLIDLLFPTYMLQLRRGQVAGTKSCSSTPCGGTLLLHNLFAHLFQTERKRLRNPLSLLRRAESPNPLAVCGFAQHLFFRECIFEVHCPQATSQPGPKLLHRIAVWGMLRNAPQPDFVFAVQGSRGRCSQEALAVADYPPRAISACRRQVRNRLR